MIGKNNIRKELIKNARDNYFKSVDEILNLFECPVITGEVLNEIVKITKMNENEIIERIQNKRKNL